MPGEAETANFYVIDMQYTTQNVVFKILLDCSCNAKMRFKDCEFYYFGLEVHVLIIEKRAKTFWVTFERITTSS